MGKGSEVRDVSDPPPWRSAPSFPFGPGKAEVLSPTPQLPTGPLLPGDTFGELGMENMFTAPFSTPSPNVLSITWP